MDHEKSSGEKLTGKRDKEHVCTVLRKEIVELQF